MNQLQFEYDFMKSEQCFVHKDQQIILIDTDLSQNSSIFKCVFCIVDDEQQTELKSLIPLPQLITKDKNEILNNWPIGKNKQLTKQLKEVTQSIEDSENKMYKINEFFQILRTQLIKQVDTLEKEFINLEETLTKMRDDILIMYNQYAAKDEIKEILLSSDITLKEKNDQISNIIKNIKNDHFKIKCDLQKAIEEMQQKNLIDFQKMNTISEQLISKLSSVHHFFENKQQALFSEEKLESVNESNFGSIGRSGLFSQEAQPIVNQSKKQKIQQKQKDQIISRILMDDLKDKSNILSENNFK